VPWDQIGFWVSAVVAGIMCLLLIGLTCLIVWVAASQHPLAGVIVGGLAALWTRVLFGLMDDADLALFKSPALDLDWPPRFAVATWALIGVSLIAGLIFWNRERRY
jgi:hypothetical protein